MSNNFLTISTEKKLPVTKEHINYDNYINDSKDEYILVQQQLPLDNIKFYSESGIPSSLDLQYEKKINLIKNKALRILFNEDVMVGYVSVTEKFLADILEKDASFLKDVLNHIYKEVFAEVELLQKFIEIMSNLDYDLLYPTNTILALGVINHIDIGVQEAAIAAFEKWDDKKNIIMLKNITYNTDWIEKYAEEVINYLESC